MGLEWRRFFRYRRITLVLGMLVAPATTVASTVPIDYPEHTVREFLKLHFAGSRAFTPSGLDKKERLLTRRFRLAIHRFFEKSVKSGSALPLVTDPFSGSQGATTWAVGDAKVRAEKAWVTVNCSDGSIEWTLVYLMRNDQERNDERWRIDDIQDRRGMMLSALLRQ
jgi:hypothetical protein